MCHSGVVLIDDVLIEDVLIKDVLIKDSGQLA